MLHFTLGKTVFTGVMIMCMLFMNSMTITVDYLNNINTNKANKEIIKEEIEELIDDYKEYEKDFAKEWIQDNPQDNYTQNDLNEIRHEALESYTNNQQYNNVDLSNTTIEFIRKNLTKEIQERISSFARISGYQPEDLIIYHYLNKIIF